MSERAFNVILDSPVAEKWQGLIEKTDFRQVLKFFRMIEADEIPEDEKFRYLVSQFFNSMPSVSPDEVVKAVMEYIACGDTEKTESAEEGFSEPVKKVFCWNQDHGRIFSAFWQAYQIDLRSVKLHWWEFNELFQNLPDNTRLMQVIALRGRVSDKNDSSEAKRELLRAQQAVALESSSEKDGDPLDDFFNALTRGR